MNSLKSKASLRPGMSFYVLDRTCYNLYLFLEEGSNQWNQYRDLERILVPRISISHSITYIITTL